MLLRFTDRLLRSRPRQPGQATTEYALILLVAAVIALGVIAWATSGDGGGRLGELFDSVLDMVLQRADEAG
ncbi:MAG: Flp family type IVb pilin [Ilumatobacteraceae bacterium]